MKITFGGNPMTLIGHELKVGESVPDFSVTDNNLNTITLKDTKGVRIFSVVPSLDTPICDLGTRTFNEAAEKLENVTVYTLSMDLPFAQARWCGNHGVKNVITLSDYKNRSFGKNFGVFIEELGLLSRAVFVVDSDNKVIHVEYVSEITNQPNFNAALAAAKQVK